MIDPNFPLSTAAHAVQDANLRQVVVWCVLITHAATILTKGVGVVLMVSNEYKTPLDRAIINNQGALMSLLFMWLSVIWLPQNYPTLLREWYIAWIVISVWVLQSVAWLIRELWRERLNPMWKDWHLKWRGRTRPK